MSLEQGLLIAIGALASAIIVLFKLIADNGRRCDADRRKLWDYILDLERRGCVRPDCPMNPGDMRRVS